MAKVRVELDRTYVLSVGVSLAAPYVAETTRQVLNRARVLTPVRTGNLRASQVMTMRAHRTYVAGTVETRVKYAEFVHRGTRPHQIRATRKNALAFFWPKVGLQTFVPRRITRQPTGAYKSKRGKAYFLISKGYVNHPGTKPRPWLFNALRQVAEHRDFIVTPMGLGSPELP
jgi:hypothetical protein